MGGGSSDLTLVARSKLGEITVVVTLPVYRLFNHAPPLSWPKASCLHLVVEDLGLASLSLGDERLVQNIENILANTLQLVFDLLAVVTDDGDVLLGALGFLLLLDGGDDTPGSTAGANDVLVSNGEKVTLIDGKFASNLKRNQSGEGCDPEKKEKGED